MAQMRRVWAKIDRETGTITAMTHDEDEAARWNQAEAHFEELLPASLHAARLQAVEQRILTPSEAAEAALRARKHERAT